MDTSKALIERQSKDIRKTCECVRNYDEVLLNSFWSLHLLRFKGVYVINGGVTRDREGLVHT